MLPLKSLLSPPALPFMRLTSPRDEREAFVALFPEPSTSALVTKLITTQELLKTNQARWNWNYNRVTSCCAQGGKLNKQALVLESGMGGRVSLTAEKGFTIRRPGVASR